MSTSLILQVRTRTADAEELTELTTGLRQTLLNAGVDDSAITAPRQHSGRSAISMERATDPALLNALLISLTSTGSLRAIVKALQVWANYRRCSITLRTPDGGELVFTGPPNAEMLERLQTALGKEDDPASLSSP